MRILLIAGHGDGDSGACGNGYREADLTREVVALIAPKLKNMCSVEIADTSKNWFEFLKSHSYNFKPYDYVLEIHFNSGGGTGTEIFVTNSEASTGVEDAIVQQIANAVEYRNRGVKRKDWSVISKVKSQGVSSALLEVCFIDSASDVDVYQNKKDAIINGIVKGIAEGFGLNGESEDIDMEKIQELEKRIAELEAKADKPEMIYNYIDDNMPQWAREPVQWCVDKGIIAGTDKGLNLNDTKLWTCVVLYRAVKFMAKLVNVKI